MALEGSLREFHLADILQLIFFQKKTGALILQGRFDRVRLLFHEGDIVGAESRKRDVENRLGRVLQKRGIITQADIQAAVDKQREEGGKFGAVLVRLGFAEKEQIQEVITFQITEILVQLFTWNEGRYEFQPQSIPLDNETGVSLNTEHFLMEGVRLVDEWSEIKDRIDIYSVFMPVEGKEFMVSPEDMKVFSLVDGESDVGTIADMSGIDSFTVSMTILGLLEKGAVARKEAEAPPESGELEAAARPIPGLKVVLSALMMLAFVFSIMVYAGTGEEYRVFRAREEVDRLRLDIEVYRYRQGNYPSAIEGVDPWGSPYIYQPSSGGFILRSIGPDGRPDTPDDIY